MLLPTTLFPLLLLPLALAGKVKYNIGYISGTEVKIHRHESTCPDNRVNTIVRNIETWSNGRFKAVKGDSTNSAIVYNASPCASFDDVNDTLTAAERAVQRGG
ncbi:hypothetical protein K461DRAFT_266619 [Myriangium duriaei CBS 260.36]|uniref:Uncharacterized protein n=1 Tax=Myriangium duriaei CBS 260.36 TaxID=1168546 RepID=A0A9P4J903_9PEZI|nr:hypothetical protein K461DRAFT_266619 [Myriangium duriaei CBS 260.36]